MAHSRVTRGKRGFLVNVTTIPPLVYPFQFNPTRVSETKRIDWGARYDAEHPAGARGLEGLADTASADLVALRQGVLGGLGATLGSATEALGRAFSAAEIKRFEKEQPRSLTFSFVIDGRERRSDEPSRRRDDSGAILGDLAIIRSFAYPQNANWLDVAGALGGAGASGADPAPTWSNLWFNEPPTLTLVLGDTSLEGFVTELKVTETLFNEDLDPTRAEVEISMIEKIDSISFILDALKRIGRAAYQSDYENAFDAIL